MHWHKYISLQFLLNHDLIILIVNIFFSNFHNLQFLFIIESLNIISLASFN